MARAKVVHGSSNSVELVPVLCTRRIGGLRACCGFPAWCTEGIDSNGVLDQIPSDIVEAGNKLFHLTMLFAVPCFPSAVVFIQV